MLSKGRVTAPALMMLATLVVVASLVATGCTSRGGTAVTSASASGNGGPSAELTGATLLSDGESPRLLLSASAPLRPSVFSRDEGRKVVVDLPDTVAAAGLEPPRPSRGGAGVISRVTMRSFSELGRPHVQFELVGPGPLAPRVEDGASPSAAMAATTVVFEVKTSPE